MTAPQIRSRKPTGRVPWPLILIEGPEKSGKTWAMALLSTSERVGQMYWLDLGEGSGDEYGAIPGTRYEILDHDGTFPDYLGQVQAVHAEAKRAAAAGEKPVVLGIDTMNDEWDGLKDWTTDRARKRASNRTRLAANPDTEIIVSTDLWNDAGNRHRRLMTLLLTFAGIVVCTARGKQVVAIGEDGKPREGVKDYRVEGHKTLAYDASLWLRTSRSDPPMVVGARSVRHGVRPGVDKPKPVPSGVQNILEWAVFEALGCDPATAHVRDIKHTTGGELTAEERGAPGPEDAGPRSDPTWLAEMQQDIAVAPADQCRPLWDAVVARVRDGGCTRADGERLQNRIKQRRAELERAAVPDPFADASPDADWAAQAYAQLIDQSADSAALNDLRAEAAGKGLLDRPLAERDMVTLRQLFDARYDQLAGSVAA